MGFWSNRRVLDCLLGDDDLGQGATGTPWRWRYRVVTETLRAWARRGVNRMASALLKSDTLRGELLDFLREQGIEKPGLTGLDAALEQMSQPVREAKPDPVEEDLKRKRNARGPIKPSNAEFIPAPAKSVGAASLLVAKGKYRWVFKEGAYRLHPFDWAPAKTFTEAKALLAARKYEVALTPEKFVLRPVKVRQPSEYDRSGARVRAYRDTELGFDRTLVDDEREVGKVRHDPEAVAGFMEDMGLDPGAIRRELAEDQARLDERFKGCKTVEERKAMWEQIGRENAEFGVPFRPWDDPRKTGEAPR